MHKWTRNLNHGQKNENKNWPSQLLPAYKLSIVSAKPRPKSLEIRNSWLLE